MYAASQRSPHVPSLDAGSRVAEPGLPKGPAPKSASNALSSDRASIPTGDDAQASGELHAKTPSGAGAAGETLGAVDRAIAPSAAADRATTGSGERIRTSTGESASGELRAKSVTGSGERIKTATGESASGELRSKTSSAGARDVVSVFDDADTVNLRPQSDRHRAATATGEPDPPVQPPGRRNRTATGEIAGGNIRTKMATGEIAVPDVATIAPSEPEAEPQRAATPTERSRSVSGELGGKPGDEGEAPPASSSHLARDSQTAAAAARESALPEEGSRRWLVPVVLVVGLGVAGLMYLGGRGNHAEPSSETPSQTAMAASGAQQAQPTEPPQQAVTPAASMDAAAVAVTVPDAALVTAPDGQDATAAKASGGESRSKGSKDATAKTADGKATDTGRATTESKTPRPSNTAAQTGERAGDKNVAKPTGERPADTKAAAKSVEDMFQAGDFAGVNAACPKIVVFTVDKLKMCAISACQTKNTALAKRWINAIERSSRASLIATCKVQGVELEQPAEAPAAPPPSSSPPSPPAAPPSGETPPSQ